MSDAEKIFIAIIAAAVVLVITVIVLSIFIGRKPPHQFKRDWEKKGRKQNE